MNSLNCTHYPDLEPNPDISGIGVVSGFFAASYIAFACCIIKAILDHGRAINDGASPILDRWASSFRSAIVSFSDQQLVTGVSILIGGYFQLYSGVAYYHWQSVVNLAWFSAVTHLITLTALRDDLHGSQKSSIMVFRIFSMGVLIIMLMYAMYPIGYGFGNDYIEPRFPAACLYHRELEWDPVGDYLYSKSYSVIYFVFACSALTYGFLSRALLLLFPTGFQKKIFSHSLNPIMAIEDLLLRSQNASTSGRIHTIGYKALHAFYAVLVTCSDLYFSKTWEITWLSTALVWGTIRILLSRNASLSFDDVPNIPDAIIKAQNAWGFGQVVPVVLLALPIISFLDQFYALDSVDARISTTNTLSAVIDGRLLRYCHMSTLVRLNPFRTGDSKARLSTVSEIRAELYHSKWYDKLLILIYFLSIAVAGDLLYTFPGHGGSYNLNDGELIRQLFVEYFTWGIINFSLILFSTVFFLDKHVNSNWESSALARYMARGNVLSFFAWLICITTLLAPSVYYDYRLQNGMVFRWS